jgi:Phage terminase, small subunit
MRSAPLLLAGVDDIAVERLCRLLDEAELTRAELARGIVLEEPIVSPTGQVVGTRVVANPAAGLLRQLDRQIDALADRLGLVPMARARLGLVLTTAERQALEVDSVLAAKYREAHT